MKILLTVTFCFFFLLKIDAQTPEIDSLQSILEQVADKRQEAEVHIELSRQLINWDMVKAIQSADQALISAKQAKDKALMVLSYYSMARVRLLSGQEFNRIDSIINEGILLAREIDDKERLLNLLQAQSAYYIYTDQPKASLEGYLYILEVAEQIGDSISWGGALSNIGQVYSSLGDHVAAINFYRKAIWLNEAIDYKPFLARSYHNYGLVVSSPDSALIYQEKALALFEELGSGPGQLTIIYDAIGNINSDRLEKYEEAINWYRKSMTVAKLSSDVGALQTTYSRLGRSFHKLNILDSAQFYLEPAYQYFKQNNLSREVTPIAEALSKIYAGQNRHKAAYEIIADGYFLKDSLFNLDNAVALAESRTKYETLEKEKEIASQKLTIAQQKSVRNQIILVALGLLFLIFGLFQYFTQRRKQKQKETELALSLQQTEARKLKELDILKSNFFANISHEFRTPLTLIISPLKEIINGTFKGNLATYHKIMHRNAERLLQLINQLLDLSKLESKEMKLKASKVDLISFTRQLAGAFSSMTHNRQIDYQMDFPEEALPIWLDVDKAEKVINNLISNAFKFTPDEGTIKVKVYESSEHAVLEVKDAGIGIAQKDLPHIFDRFYQVDAKGTRSYEGSGIGLALAKELVELHGGQIAVQSEEGKGSVFSVKWLKGEQHLSENQKVNTAFVPKELTVIATATVPRIAKSTNGQRETVLLVEDNEDVRFYIKDKLHEAFEVEEAVNGQDGLEKALKLVPDLIISDVMMPEMDGNQMAQQLRSKEETSHIPIIMLTAKGDIESKLEGLKTGADDYLTKPIDARELLVRVENLLEQRKKLRVKYAQELLLVGASTSKEETNPEDKFMQKVLQVVNEHLEDETFGVEDLAKAMLLSRYQLLRKIKALTGKSASVFIRWVRLSKAKELLERQEGNVSEVAFRLGFNSVAYFSKCFKEEFGYSPSKVS